MVNVQSVEYEEQDQIEEQARAGLYGLLAELFYAPPSASLVERIALSKAQGESAFDHAWNMLSATCERLPHAKTEEEYAQLFISVGKPEVVLYASYYMTGFMMEKPLAELRTALARLGLERADAVAESEDHISALCDVMRHLILERSGADTFATQKQFFSEFIQPWYTEMCTDLAAHSQADFYASVAYLAKAFFEVEAQAFEMA